MDTYTKTDLAKASFYKQVTPNGVAYEWWLAGPQGAGFALLAEPHHTVEDIETAKRHLRAERDVVGRIGVRRLA